MDEDELFVYAKKIQAPFSLLQAREVISLETDGTTIFSPYEAWFLWMLKQSGTTSRFHLGGGRGTGTNNSRCSRAVTFLALRYITLLGTRSSERNELSRHDSTVLHCPYTISTPPK